MFGFSNKKIKLVTHDGTFHADDIFACATLQLVFDKEGKKYSVTRTRDEKIISEGDYVFDLGGEYSPEKNMYDHHQVGGAGRREAKDKEPAIEYAAFGLIWKHFGPQLVPNMKVWGMIDKRLTAPIDAWDNGFNLAENKFDITPYNIQAAFGSFIPTWNENRSTDEMFLKCVQIAKEILKREIIGATDSDIAEGRVLEAYHNAPDKKVIILDKNYPYEYALRNFSETLYVINHREEDDTWALKALRIDPKEFPSRKDLPRAWSGLRDEELQKVTGVPDAVFCHRALFLAVAKSKEGAMKLAHIALES